MSKNTKWKLLVNELSTIFLYKAETLCILAVNDMNYFSTCMDALMKKRRISASDLSRAVGKVGTPISEAQISKWLNGRQISVSEGYLTTLSKVLAETPEESAELTAAHCKDERFGPHADLVDIRVIGQRKLKPETPTVTLPPKHEAAYQWLKEHLAENSTAREWMLSSARVMGWNE